MATNVTLNGTTYAIPGLTETGWGDEVSNYLIAQASGLLQKAGGAFTLTAEVDFGNTYGLKSAYFTSRGTAASAGILRLANTEAISWRGSANTFDLDLTVNGSDRLAYNGVVVPTISSGDTFIGKTINANNNTILNIADANISPTANIAFDKMEVRTASRAVVTDGAGVIAASTITSTELGYLSGVSGSVQTQLNNKQADVVTTRGDVVVGNSFGNADRLPVGSANQVLTTDGTDVLWAAASSGSGTGEVNYIDNSNFEVDLTGWNTYDDGTTATPVDGTGGTSANLTLTKDTTTVLRGDASLKIAKAAANAQGEGVSYDFTIKGQDTGKLLKIQFDYKTDEDATYQDGDFAVYIVADPGGTPTLITPIDNSIRSDQDVFVTEFLSTSSLSYRLIFHCTASHADAFDLYIDDVLVGNGSVQRGAAIGPTTVRDVVIGDWINATGLSINQGEIRYQRVGDNLVVDVFTRFNGTGSSTSTLSFNWSGLLAEIGVSQSGATYQGTFSGYSGDSGVGGVAGLTFIDETSEARFFAHEKSGDELALLGNDFGGTTGFSYIGFQANVKIVEWEGKGIVPMLTEDNLSQWQGFTPGVATGSITITDVASRHRRVGDSMEVFFDFDIASASATGNAIDLDIPLGLTADSSLVDTVVRSFAAEGFGMWHDDSAGLNIALGLKIESDRIRLNRNDGSASDPSLLDSDLAAGDRITGSVMIPIAEWAGSQNSLVGYSQADGTRTGLLPPVTSMSEALATQLGLRQYESTADSITVTPSSGSLSRAVFVPYQTYDGTWRCRLNITVAAMTGSSGTIAVGGMTSVNAGLRQGINCSSASTPSTLNVNAFIPANSGTINVNSDTVGNISTVAVSGDIELESKPTWAT